MNNWGHLQVHKIKACLNSNRLYGLDLGSQVTNNLENWLWLSTQIEQGEIEINGSFNFDTNRINQAHTDTHAYMVIPGLF